MPGNNRTDTRGIYCTIDALNTDCPICGTILDTLKFTHKYLLTCNHEVCHTCWLEWYVVCFPSKSVLCPLCRSKQIGIKPRLCYYQGDIAEFALLALELNAYQDPIFSDNSEDSTDSS